jgi:hypothetical protein
MRRELVAEFDRIGRRMELAGREAEGAEEGEGSGEADLPPPP